MKRCDYLGCQAKATVFSKEKSYCLKHAETLGLVGQTDLVRNFGFPDIQKKLKIGDKQGLNKNEQH